MNPTTLKLRRTRKYFMYLSKCLTYSTIALLMIINLKIYAIAVKESQQDYERGNKRALALVDKIGKDAMIGAFKGTNEVKPEDLQELKKNLKYLPGSKQYENLKALLKSLPAQVAPKNEQEKQVMEKCKNLDVKPRDIEKAQEAEQEAILKLTPEQMLAKIKQQAPVAQQTQVTTAPVTTAPVTTVTTQAPVTTAPAKTAPVTTQVQTQAPVAQPTQPVATAPVAQPVTTAPVAQPTQPVTTAPGAQPVTTAPVAQPVK